MDAYIPVIIQFLGTVGAVFGGAGFWSWMSERKSKREGAAKDIKDIRNDIASLKTSIKELKQANKDIVDQHRKYEDSEAERLKVVTAERQAMIGAQCDLMRERLLDFANQCLEKGYYTQEERETYKALFDRYTGHPYNGNGVIHDLQPKLVNLPWTKEEADALKKKK